MSLRLLHLWSLFTFLWFPSIFPTSSISSIFLFPFAPHIGDALPLSPSPIWRSSTARGASLLPRLAAPIRHRSERRLVHIFPFNAPSHQTSTSSTIHRQQTSTSYRQPQNNSLIFRITNIRHGWRQGKIIWRQVVWRQGRSRWRKEATEPLEQGWSPVPLRSCQAFLEEQHPK